MEGDGKLQVYRSCEPVVDALYERDGKQSIVGTVADALAEASGVATTELAPLYETIDTDTIISLVEHDSATDDERVLGFTVENWNVFVHADGRIRICDRRTQTDPEPVFETPTV